MTEDLITTVQGAIGRIRLNRPKALHALNSVMCNGVLEALESWRGDPAVEAIVVDHAEGRGFCAGGDIRMLPRRARPTASRRGRSFMPSIG